MMERGDCVSCAAVSNCKDTGTEKFLNDYTCALYRPVDEPIYRARVEMMVKYGEVMAAEAILGRSRKTDTTGDM